MIAILKPGTIRFESGTVLKSADYQRLTAAEKLLELAQQEYDNSKSAIDEAFKEAKKEGYDKGIKAAQLRMSVRHLELVRNSVAWLSELEGGLSEAVNTALHKIVDEIGPQDVLLSMIRKSLTSLQGQQKLRILANQGTLDHLRKDLSVESKINITFAVDAQLSNGEATIESPVGIVRLNLDGMLDQFAAAVRSTAGEIEPKAGKLAAPTEDE